MMTIMTPSSTMTASASSDANSNCCSPGADGTTTTTTSDDDTTTTTSAIKQSSSSRISRRLSQMIQKLDAKIVTACNDLMIEQTQSAKQRVANSTELTQIMKQYHAVKLKFHQTLFPSEKLKKKKNRRDSKGAGNAPIRYHDAILKVFNEQEEKEAADVAAVDGDAPAAPLPPSSSQSPSSPTSSMLMSPYLQGQLASLCYHVHIMTLGEDLVITNDKLHDDYRVIVNWLHTEYWEKIENETKQIQQEKIQPIILERKQLQNKLQEQIQTLEMKRNDILEQLKELKALQKQEAIRQTEQDLLEQELNEVSGNGGGGGVSGTDSSSLS